MSNLLLNALRYTPARRGNCHALPDGDHQVQVTVENPGTPIAPEHLPRLFDRFYALTLAKRRR
ncbi:ATP-binding protein [Shigella flexneri]